ncbi:hypothetical protein ACFORO_36225 [Amycolatopsis halotolerans]|uniref:Fibronectin type-III domain-containing protein n=1 Tax=Amycolatopsis halotolerans TaxID=330083 RepID=A0ABV7QQT7_9PSEU
MAEPFDAKAYEDSVVKPLKGRLRQGLPDDLLERYAIDLAMSDQEVAQRLREVRSKWNKGLGGVGFARQVYQELRKADDQLQREHGTGLTRIEWWRTYAASRARRRTGRVEDFAEDLRSNFGELGLIEQKQLDAMASAAAASLSPGEVGEALTKAHIRRCVPPELPVTSGLVDATYRSLRDHLLNAEKHGVVDLVSGEPAPFRLLDPKAAPDLSVSAVTRAAERENKRAGNEGARQALAILSSAAKNGVDLRQLALFHVLDDLRRQHGLRVPPRTLLKPLLQAKLEADEAKLLVFGVLNESAHTPAGSLASVRALLAQGRLNTAQRTLAAIPGADDAAAAAELVDRQLVKVRDLVAASRLASRERDEAGAADRLREALALSSDDDQLHAELRQIPPVPVLEVSAQEEGITVRVSWRPAPSHDEATRYHVVRKEGRIPSDAADGIVIATSTASTVCVDSEAPASTPLGYAVFAAVESGAWSRPTGVTAEAVPGVAEVRLDFTDGVVEGQWTVHPDAVDVAVRRDDGTEIRTIDRTRFRDQPAGDDSEQTYTFVARYRRADGSAASSKPVRARVGATRRPLPVRALKLNAIEDDRGPRIELCWKVQPDAEIVVRRAVSPCPWDFGEVVPASELDGYGEQVLGSMAEAGGWHTLTASAPPGKFHYVPFTLGPDGAIRGHSETLGTASPVTGLRCQRFGDDVLLAWEWPGQAGVAEVCWQTEQESGQRDLTRQQYHADGGCRIRCGQGRVLVGVRAKVLAEGGECVSREVGLTIPGNPLTVSYSVAFSRRPMLGGGTVRIRLTADQEVPRCAVVVVALQGPVMPRRPADGLELLRGERNLRPGDPVELTAELPRLRKPYWVRCFVETDGVRLVDPSTKQMKVS